VILTVAAIIFALSYMVFTGIFIFTEKPIPDEYKVPMFYFGRIHTVYGDFPWFIAYLDRHTIFSMTMEALASTAVISGLVGINSSLAAFRFSTRKACRIDKGSVGFFGIIPAFLSIFACCGGGILVLLFGSGILTALFSYGPIFSVVSIGTLSAGIILSTKEIEKSQRSVYS
jgi:hypothetical protein